MQFYKNLKRARVRMGKSQIEVAKAVGISNAALSNYETGYREPDLDTLCALASYYGITLDELVDVKPKDSEPIYDLEPISKNRYIGFKGQVYELKESQKKVLLRELEGFFEKYAKSMVETENGKVVTHRHPHINRGGLPGGNLAVSRSTKRQDPNR